MRFEHAQLRVFGLELKSFSNYAKDVSEHFS